MNACRLTQLLGIVLLSLLIQPGWAASGEDGWSGNGDIAWASTNLTGFAGNDSEEQSNGGFGLRLHSSTNATFSSCVFTGGAGGRIESLNSAPATANGGIGGHITANANSKAQLPLQPAYLNIPHQGQLAFPNSPASLFATLQTSANQSLPASAEFPSLAPQPTATQPTASGGIYRLIDSDFIGGQGGIITNSGFSQCNGGHGLMIHSGQTVEADGILAVGGKGGAYYGDSSAFAGGGNGLEINNVAYIALSNSIFKGGDGGRGLKYTPDDRFPLGLIPPQVNGGHGLNLIKSQYTAGTAELILKNVTAIGGNGGSVPESKHRSDADGGHGATISGFSSVIIDGGIYQGGAGGIVFLEQEDAYGFDQYTIGDGGMGLLLEADSAVIHAGTFNGEGWREGVWFSGKTLEIHGGEFGKEDVFYAEGLYATVSEAAHLHGGHYQGISIRNMQRAPSLLVEPNGDGSISLVNKEEQFPFIEVSIGDQVRNEGGLRLSGNIRLPELNPEAYQVLSSHGHLILEKDLETAPNTRLFINGRIEGQALKLRRDSKMELFGLAELNELHIENEASVCLNESYEYMLSGESTMVPTRINSETIRIEDHARIEFSPYYEQMRDEPQVIAHIYADHLLHGSISNAPTLTREQLEQVLVLDNLLLTDLDYTWSSGTNGNHIKITGTRARLAENSNSPFPKPLAAKLDQMLRGETEPVYEYRVLLAGLTIPLSEKEVHGSMQRYFNQAAAPMAYSTLQAGRQAQIKQLHEHMRSVRSVGSSRDGQQILGAAGPQELRKSLSGWAKGYKTDLAKDQDGTFEGYDADIYGAVLGIEKRFSHALIGLSGGYAQMDISGRTVGNLTTVESRYGSIYGSLFTEKWFIDANGTYGRNAIETQREAASSARAEFDADQYSAYVGGGYHHSIGNGLVLTPELGVQASHYDQERYTEISNIAASEVDPYNQWAYHTIIALSATTDYTVNESIHFRPSLRLQWQHELGNDPDQQAYRALDTRMEQEIQSGETDQVSIGAGLKTEYKDWLELDLRIDQEYAQERESTTYSGRIAFLF